MRTLVSIICMVLVLINGWVVAPDAPVEADEQNPTEFVFTWEKTFVEILNNSTNIAVLIIDPIGPGFDANITFTCPQTFVCPVDYIEPVRLMSNKRIEINYTYRGKINMLNPRENEEITANLVNETVDVNLNANFYVKLILPISVEYNGDYYARDHETIYSYSRGHRDIKESVKITNYDQWEDITGYIGMSGAIFSLKAPMHRPFSVFNQTQITIPKNQSCIIEINFPKEYNEELERFWYTFVFSDVLVLPRNIHLYDLNISNGRLIGANTVNVYYTISDSVDLNVRSTDGTNFGDVWNGTELTLTVFNGGTLPLIDISINMIDKIPPFFSAFDFASFTKITEVKIGKVDSNKWTSVNISVFSDISGPHYFYADYSGPPNARSNYLYLFLSSGLGLSYNNETIEWITNEGDSNVSYLRKDADMRTKNRLEIEINNPSMYEGEVSLSITPVGWSNELFDHHGNGWLHSDDFVVVEPSSIHISKLKEIVVFNYVPKFSGTVVLIPQVKVNGKVLLPDKNTQNQKWVSSPCDRGRSDNFHFPIDNIDTNEFFDYWRGLPKVCSMKDRAPLQFSYNKAQLNFINTAIVTLIIAATISGIDFYRRVLDERRYLRCRPSIKRGNSCRRNRKGRLK